MRPTIDEQLGGASRLLTLAENEPDAEGVTELVRNARRLVDRVSSSWAAAEPFLRGDNAELAALLETADPTPPDPGLQRVVDVNESLRFRLSDRIRDLGPGASRDEIGTYLRRRLTVDPT
ncbi:hypothetical protein [Gordonia humi]|uniref:Uncharacterized protein n=1 Tax=Gordonia humi TaxID=686429 RepID=A0A840F2H8_9ACTN|nr:hypothetical protein [Gordonia humi]MBB4135599.1 hypothetical protein [Gordonia humi]